MIVKSVKSPIFIVNVKNHKKIKLSFLDYFQNLLKHNNQKNSYKKNDYKVSNTDWFIDKNIKRNYESLFYKVIEDNLVDSIKKIFLCNNIEIHNYWFHQYLKNDNYDWHTHSKSQYSSIYYIELPNKKYKTIFKDIDIDVNEGDILSFPSYLLHKSPILNDERKTILSFNFSVF